MVRKAVTLLLVAFTLLFSGCSWQSEFLVFNHSDANAIVRLLLHDKDTTFSGFQTKAYQITQWKEDAPELGKEVVLSATKYPDGAMEFDLPANTALVIANGLNVDMRTPEGRKLLLANVDSLTITQGGSSRMVCTKDLCEPGSISLGMARAGIVFRH